MLRHSLRAALTTTRPTTRTATATATATAVRHQSTKSANTSHHAVKSAVAAKVSEQKKESYNALSNQNLVAQQAQQSQQQTQQQQQKSQQKPPQKRIKKDYSALPRVASTAHINPQKIAIDSFYAGYRPLLMAGLKQNLLPSRKKSLFDLGLEDEPVWAYSAAGLEVFPEWDRVPLKHLKDHTPFKPPMSEAEKEKREAQEREMKAREESKKQEELKTGRKGRVRPAGHRLLKNKKKFVL